MAVPMVWDLLPYAKQRLVGLLFCRRPNWEASLRVQSVAGYVLIPERTKEQKAGGMSSVGRCQTRRENVVVVSR